MAQQKNISPSQLSAIASIIISIIVAAGLFFLDITWWKSLCFTAIIFCVSYFILLNAIQRFIYRKIKLIYKLINQTKASKREDFYYKNILPRKSIEQVSEEVEEWSQQHRSEIEVLQQNEAFRKEFLQNLSHELKTPIFSIQGYIDTLLGGALHNEAVNIKFLQNAARNVDRLVNLVDDLDEISRLESGELQMNYKRFVIQDLIKEVFESLDIVAQENEIHFQIKKGCESPITVYADKDKIRQVLSNLVDNATKYGKQQGIVEASCYDVDEKNVLVEISDNGAGIAEEHLPRIFERFYRTDLARSRRAGGSGLGLAICKHIIEAHGQSIHVRSKPDVGSSFGFTLKKGN